MVIAISVCGSLALAQPSLPKNSKPGQARKSRREAADLPESHPTKTGDAATAHGTNATDPVEAEYQKLLDEDDKAQEEVDRWIQDNQKFAKEGAGVPDAELNQ